VGFNARAIDLVLSVVTAALPFPILTFIGIATRLSAARREQRFAAMRLVGATPRQISVISAVESSVAAVTGAAAGFGLFYLLRPALARINFTGGRFFTADLALNAPDILFVAIGVPLAAAGAARLALRRVTISPLRVTRSVTPPRPRAWRVLPLLAGLGELAWFVHAVRTARRRRDLALSARRAAVDPGCARCDRDPHGVPPGPGRIGARRRRVRAARRHPGARPLPGRDGDRRHGRRRRLVAGWGRRPGLAGGRGLGRPAAAAAGPGRRRGH